MNKQDIFNNAIAIVSGTVAGEAAKVRAELESIIATSNKSDFDIGWLLYQIKVKGFYTGFNTFQEYADTLNIKKRKRQYLLTIAEVMDTVGIPRTTYEPVGKAKLRVITSLDPFGTWVSPEGKEHPIKEFIIGLVENSNKLTFNEIQQHVKTLKGQVGENDIEFLRLAFTKQVMDNVIRPALNLAKNNIGSVNKDSEGISQDASDSRALELIAADYLSDPNNGG
jgi:hypothetical protein